MWFKINAQNLVLQSLPTFLRTGSISSFIALAASELTELNNALVVNRIISISKVSHNSQVCKLRKILNDTFDNERRIKVVEGVLKSPKYIYTDAEHKAKWLGEIVIFTGSETEGNGIDFTVLIPTELKNYQTEIKALVNFYKLAGKQFKIIIDETI
ncbi:hypothetical protein [Chryseobacterium arthrosphaerae]|uniref:hypothetical protein n=1 Tax=Chryseobacterium arthrosphaerae TaxID=651561 RepID=UPI003D33492E